MFEGKSGILGLHSVDLRQKYPIIRNNFEKLGRGRTGGCCCAKQTCCWVQDMVGKKNTSTLKSPKTLFFK